MFVKFPSLASLTFPFLDGCHAESKPIDKYQRLSEK